MINHSMWVFWGSAGGLLAGAILGYYFPYWVNSFEFIPRLFINGLKLILVPLILTSIILAVTQISGSVKSAGAIAKSFVYFLSTTTIAVLTGVVLVMLFNTGTTGIESVGQFPDSLRPLASEPLSGLLENLVPTSIPEAILMGNYPAILLIAIIIGIALSLSGKSAKVLIEINKSVYDLLYKIIEFVMVALPVALFLISASLFSQNGYNFPEILSNLSSFFMVLLIGLAIHSLFVLPLILKRLGKQSPLDYFKGILPAFTTAFATGSAITTLPVTTECAITNCRGNKNAPALVIPLGSVFNLNATAMFAIIAALTAANIYSIELDMVTILMMISGAVLASFGISGITYGSLILTTLLFGIAELPTSAYGFIGLLFLADWFSSRLLAVVNIWSDVTGSAVISEYIEPQKKVRKSSRVSTGRRASYSRAKDSSREKRPASSSSYKSKTERSPRADKVKRYSRERSDSFKRSDERKTSAPASESSKYMRPERSSSARTDRNVENKAFEIYSEKEMPIDLDAPVPKTITPRSAPRSRPTIKSASIKPTKSTKNSAPKIIQKSTFDITSPPKSLPTMKSSAPSIDNFETKEEKTGQLKSETVKPETVKAEPVMSEPIKPEFDKPEAVTPEASMSEPETVSETEPVSKTVGEDKPEIKFGRKSRTAGKAQKDDPVTESLAEKTEPKPKPQEEKPQTFGRTRKKRA